VVQDIPKLSATEM